jgi:hypothetical protein
MAKRKIPHRDRNLTSVILQVSIPSLIEISRFILCARAAHKLGISEAAVTPQTEKKIELNLRKKKLIHIRTKKNK